MPRFHPFRALRYSPDILDHVVAPPYDVLSDSDRAELADRHPQNIVHVDVPLEADGPDRYSRAAERLATWRDAGVLTLDPIESLTVYRMKFTDDAGRSRSTVGVIGALEVVDENAGGVLPHERTTPKAKTDRLDLTRATSCNLSPVWGLSLGQGLSTSLEIPGSPMGTVEVDGVQHTFERIVDPARIAQICASIASHDVVIADGHHRYAISRSYRDEQRASGSPLADAATLTMTYVAELVEEQLSVAAIHRMYDIEDQAEFDTVLTEHFEFIDCPVAISDITSWMRDQGALVLLRPSSPPRGLVPRSAAFSGVRDLDGSRLEHALRTCSHDVRYQHGVHAVDDLIRSGAADAAILIRPVSVDEIRRTAREHELMPPKSTFFTPKILTGVVLRPLDD